MIWSPVSLFFFLVCVCSSSKQNVVRQLGLFIAVIGTVRFVICEEYLFSQFAFHFSRHFVGVRSLAFGFWLFGLVFLGEIAVSDRFTYA